LATPVLKPLLFEATATPGTVPGATPLPSIKLDSVQLTLLAAYGLVYCYIASAPILVFHAGRFLLTLRAGGRVWAKRFLLCLTPPIVFAIVTWCLGSTLILCHRWFLSTAAFFVVLIVWLQYLVVVLALLKSEAMFTFYQRLASSREQSRGGITDSYRHLREHGNSFFIVLLEILLGLVLVGAGMLGDSGSAGVSLMDSKLQLYLAILFIWILPAVLVWLVGTLFERRFSGADAEPGAQATARSAAPERHGVRPS
jgi:hypothetical protein